LPRSTWPTPEAPSETESQAGWFDPEHTNHLGKYRMTLWEIHPITMIEVFKNGAWVALDQLP
jgi:hypothetical protein